MIKKTSKNSRNSLIITKNDEITRQHLTNFSENKALEWLDETQILSYLKVSRSTLFRLRKQKLIKFSKVGGRAFYAKQLIDNMLLLQLLK